MVYCLLKTPYPKTEHDERTDLWEPVLTHRLVVLQCDSTFERLWVLGNLDELVQQPHPCERLPSFASSDCGHIFAFSSKFGPAYRALQSLQQILFNYSDLEPS